MPQPFELGTKVVACGGERGVCGIAGSVGEVTAAHAVLGLEVPNHRLDRLTPPHLALDRWRHAPLLARSIYAELIGGRRFVATVSGIGENALDGAPDEHLYVEDNSFGRVSASRRQGSPAKALAASPRPSAGTSASAASGRTPASAGKTPHRRSIGSRGSQLSVRTKHRPTDLPTRSRSSASAKAGRACA